MNASLAGVLSSSSSSNFFFVFAVFLSVVLFFSLCDWSQDARGSTPLVCRLLQAASAAVPVEEEGGDYADLFQRDWHPPLPVVEKTFIVEETKLTQWGKFYQELQPDEEFLILVVNSTAFKMMPRFYMQEAFDVNDRICDLVSLKPYTRLFPRLPPDYIFWTIQHHRTFVPTPASAASPSTSSSAPSSAQTLPREDEKNEKDKQGPGRGGDRASNSSRSAASSQAGHPLTRGLPSSFPLSPSSPSSFALAPPLAPAALPAALSATRGAPSVEKKSAMDVETSEGTDGVDDVDSRDIFADENGLSIKSLLFRAPPEKYLKQAHTEFCVIARRRFNSRLSVTLVIGVTKKSSSAATAGAAGRSGFFFLSRFFSSIRSPSAHTLVAAASLVSLAIPALFSLSL